MRSFRLFLFFFFLLSFFSFFSFIDGTIRNCPGCNFQGDDFQGVLSSMFFTLFFFFSLACLPFNDIKYFLERWFAVGISGFEYETNMMVFRYVLLPEYVKYSNFFLTGHRIYSDKLTG